jgi:hypothetical protein
LPTTGCFNHTSIQATLCDSEKEASTFADRGDALRGTGKIHIGCFGKCSVVQDRVKTNWMPKSTPSLLRSIRILIRNVIVLGIVEETVRKTCIVWLVVGASSVALRISNPILHLHPIHIHTDPYKGCGSNTLFCDSMGLISGTKSSTSIDSALRQHFGCVFIHLRISITELSLSAAFAPRTLTVLVRFCCRSFYQLWLPRPLRSPSPPWSTV